MEEKHLVSVIIPVFNGGRFLNKAIESVLNQTYKNFEIIVVDDGSNDNSAEIAKSYCDVIYKYQENGGVASARNNALSKVKGDFIAFLDADDFYPKDKLEIQVNHLKDNENTDCCIGHVYNFIEPGYYISTKDLDHFSNKEKIALPTLVAKKYVFDQVGHFNINYISCSDFEWITRAIELKIKIDILPDLLLNRRIHDTNLSITRKKKNFEMRFRIIKESLDRKRRNLKK
jgi:glycosyltransferase involved in cell wall biosynthesis